MNELTLQFGYTYHASSYSTITIGKYDNILWIYFNESMYYSYKGSLQISKPSLMATIGSILPYE